MTTSDAGTEPVNRVPCQRQIEPTGAEIDALVYELYGLTEEEIAIVEGRDQRWRTESMGTNRSVLDKLLRDSMPGSDGAYPYWEKGRAQCIDPRA